MIELTDDVVVESGTQPADDDVPTLPLEAPPEAPPKALPEEPADAFLALIRRLWRTR